jgi:hypothetical protein
VNKAIKKSAAFQFSQGLDQHLLRNVRDGTLEFVKATSSPLETEQNNWAPGIGNGSQDLSRWVLRVVKGFGIDGFGAFFQCFMMVTKWCLLVKWLPSR